MIPVVCAILSFGILLSATAYVRKNQIPTDISEHGYLNYYGE